MPRLTSHVLDTARGAPASGVVIDLHVIEGETRRLINSTITDSDGRTTSPLLAGNGSAAGIYEITFHAASYFARVGVATTDPPFLGDVVIRVGLSDAEAHYHVPLLLSPYGYSTYRGS